MPLSEHEQRLLEQMERALYAEDPKFATSLRNTSSGRANRSRAAVGVLVLIAGVAMVLGGVIVPLIPLGVAGFVVMVMGATLAYLGLRARPATAPSADGAPASPGQSAPRAPKQSSGFMNRLEDRWRKRHDDGLQ